MLKLCVVAPHEATLTCISCVKTASKNLDRGQTIALCTLYSSAPHLMVKSEYFPESRSPLTALCRACCGSVPIMVMSSNSCVVGLLKTLKESFLTQVHGEEIHFGKYNNQPRWRFPDDRKLVSCNRCGHWIWKKMFPRGSTYEADDGCPNGNPNLTNQKFQNRQDKREAQPIKKYITQKRNYAYAVMRILYTLRCSRLDNTYLLIHDAGVYWMW